MTATFQIVNGRGAPAVLAGHVPPHPPNTVLFRGVRFYLQSTTGSCARYSRQRISLNEAHTWLLNSPRIQEKEA